MATSRLSIRSAHPGDHARYVELYRALDVDDPAWPRDRFVAEMLATTLVAEREGIVIGYAFFRAMKDASHLSQLVTAPEARRSGIARALIDEVVLRARALGCSSLTLNVLRDNEAAIALYESVGLTRYATTRTLRIAWDVVDAWPTDATPHASSAREIAPHDDARLEPATGLPAGHLSYQRALPHRVLRVIEADAPAVCVFDPRASRVYTLRAPDVDHAASLLRALRTYAHAEDASVQLTIEEAPALADALVARGAVRGVEKLSMRRSIGG